MKPIDYISAGIYFSACLLLLLSVFIFNSIIELMCRGLHNLCTSSSRIACGRRCTSCRHQATPWTMNRFSFPSKMTSSVTKKHLIVLIHKITWCSIRLERVQIRQKRTYCRYCLARSALTSERGSGIRTIAPLRMTSRGTSSVIALLCSWSSTMTPSGVCTSMSRSDGKSSLTSAASAGDCNLAKLTGLCWRMRTSTENIEHQLY